jgi:hypothetical protein
LNMLAWMRIVARAKRALPFGVLVAAATVGCTSGTTPNCDAGEMCGPGVDGNLPEGSLPDSSSEAGPEAGPDSTPDVVPDVMTDGSDATPG